MSDTFYQISNNVFVIQKNCKCIPIVKKNANYVSRVHIVSHKFPLRIHRCDTCDTLVSNADLCTGITS